ncbi:MAG: haloacid dehalogenase-like hydrolase [Candidatus Niameybacter stercoravium]|nr:haloacid dehalogenase-like hydrolase [Candidatus Niameybacter stercoravium]
MKLAIFDFDGTLFPEQTIPFFMKYYVKAGYPKGAYSKYYMRVMGKVLKYKNPLIKDYDKEQFRKEAALLFIQMFNGMDKEILSRFLSDVAEKVIENLNIAIVQEVKKCKAEGYYTILLSGCYTPILEYVAEAIKIDQVIGTPIEESHIVQEKVAIDGLDIATGKRKVQKLLKSMQGKAINWEESTAYGDSSYDRNILELVGYPVAVRPDEGLKEIAMKNNWRVIK